MDDFKEISVDEARKKLESGLAVFVDVRDPASYEAAHVPGALLLNDANVQKFVDQTDKKKPVVVYCYHGHTSQGAAAYLLDQGFEEVYSVIGGFERWKQTEKFES
ncbi:MAG TPA: thiosulfate sulfurtransferase GlpE [bacterium]|nr:thiosulfate sulfurtransferase GlpE [bacterium]